MFTRQLKLLFSINRVVCTRDSDFWKIFHLFICPFNFPFRPLLDIVAYDTYVIRSLLNIIRKMPDIRSFYTSVLSQAFSPCEDFLAAGTNFGNLNIFRYLYWNYSILQDFPQIYSNILFVFLVCPGHPRMMKLLRIIKQKNCHNRWNNFLCLANLCKAWSHWKTLLL